MTPNMLMQPFEQSFTVLPGNYYASPMLLNQESYMMYPIENLDFRPTFYNPFEIKHRRRTSRAQLKVLEKSFSENPKPNATIRRILAQQLDMTPRGVQIWFQNRRAKAKLLGRKSQQAEKVNAQTIATTAAASCMSDEKSNWMWSPEYNNRRESQAFSSLYNWSSPSSHEFLQQLNHSPQQLTPNLSPIQSGYYDSCLDLILSPTPML